MSRALPASENAPTDPDPGRIGGSTAARGIARAAGLILAVTILARIAGFVRYLVFGATVGGGDVGTAYASANLLPNVLFEVVAGGALAGCVIPLVAGLMENDEDGTGAQRASRVVSALLGWVLLVTIPLALAITLLAAPLAHLILDAGSTGAGTVEMGTRMLRVFAVQIPLYGVTVLLGAFLQARRRFLWPALVPLISSLVVMAAYGVYTLLAPTVATTSTVSATAEAVLAWGTTAGVLLMAVPLLVPARRAGLRLVPTLRMPEGLGRRALALGGAGIGAVAAQQLTTALVLLLAARAGGTGTLPVFQYAQAVYLLPFAVLVVPITTSVFPHLSELRLTGDRDAFARTTAFSLRTVTAVGAIGAAVLFAAAPAIDHFFRLLDRAGVTGVGSTVAALALGLAPYAVSTQCTRVLSAALRARDALLVGSVGWGVSALAILAVVLPAGTRRAAEASTAFGLCIAAGMTVSAVVGLVRVLDLVPAVDMRRALTRGALVSVAAVALGAVAGYVVCRAVLSVQSATAATVLIGMLAGAVALLVTGGIIALADPELRDRFLALARRRDAHRSATGARA